MRGCCKVKYHLPQKIGVLIRRTASIKKCIGMNTCNYLV